MKVVEVKHPLVKHKLGLMREADISTKRFRELAKEVGSLLTYEATADFETEKVTIDGWNGPVEVDQIKGKKVTVVPILRAGLGMMDGVLCSVFVVRCTLFVVCCACVRCCPLFVVRCCSLCVVRCSLLLLLLLLLFVVRCCSLFVVRCSLFVVRCIVTGKQIGRAHV